MMWGYGWGWWVFGALMMLVFWGGLAALVAFLVRGSGRPRDEWRDPSARDPVAILEERFARGEISKEELEERKRVLQGRAA
jgi:putative membrane protein